MSSLSVGIVGLPNVGKSTLFNALLKKQVAYVANFPFATIEPNVGVVGVPDERLAKLAEVVLKAEKMNELPPQVPASVTFIDIAGLIKGASQGEGLGNKFLAHIREVDAIVHVVRNFTDKDVIKEGVVDPKADLELVQTELQLADLQTTEKHKQKKGAEPEKLPLLADKPVLVVVNSDEKELKRSGEVETQMAGQMGLEVSQVLVISAKVEAELAEFSEKERREYLKELGIYESGLERLIKKAYQSLGLMSFLTAGAKEVRAWTVKKGVPAYQAAGVIHTDFSKKFIKAQVVAFDDFITCGGWKGCREAGKTRMEGRDYVLCDGEIVEFMIGS